MPTEFTFEEAGKPAAKEFSFEEANTFSFEDAAGARDTSGDSYEAQLKDLGLTEADVAAAMQPIEQRSDLLAEQQKAARTGDYWGGVANRVDNLTGAVVEPLSRPLSGAVGRAIDTALPAGAKVVEQALQQPAIDLPHAGDAKTGTGKVAAGIYNAARDLLAGFTSPDMVALLPAGANKAVLTAWISQMAGHQPERVLRAAELFKSGKTQEAVQEIATGVGELGMAEMGRRHVTGAENLKPADVNGAPALRINAAGEVVDLPNPDLVARNLAAPGTMRPTEQQAMVSPTEGHTRPEVVIERVPILNQRGEVVDVRKQPRIREIVIEAPDVIEPQRRFLKPDVEGGKISFAAEAPVLNREAIGPRTEPVTKEVIDNGQRQEEGRQTLLDQPIPERPAPTIEAPQSPPAESRVQPVSAPEAQAPEVARPAERLTTPPDPSTVIRPAASETITRPGVPGNEGQASEILAEREKRLKPRVNSNERPWDIIDEIEGQVGGTIDPRLLRELNPDWRPHGAARKLFRVGGRGADSVLNALTYKGPVLGLTKDMGLQEFGDAINAAARARQEWRSRGAKERKQLDAMGKEAQTRGQFEAKVIGGERPKSQQNNVETVRVDNLVVGDRFKVQDHKFEITDMATDEDGALTSVTLKDGPKFGVQTMGDVGQIFIDKGTLRRNRKARESAWEVPTETPAAPVEAPQPPQIKTGQNQGDLLGSGDVDFNLYSERTSDGARIAAEKAQAEANRVAAEEFARKNQQEMRGVVSGTAAEGWADRTIQQSRGRVNTGLDPELFAAWVVKGAAHVERGIRKFSDWSRKMIAEHGDAIRPHLRRIFDESNRAYQRTTADLGALKHRKLAARGSQSPDVAPVHRERLKTGTEAFYEPQDMGRVEDVVAKMTSDELGSVPLMQPDGQQNIGVAARLESYRRLVAADNLDAAWRVIDDLMKQGTSLGQLVNQFKLLRGATPDGVLVMLNKQLRASGYDPVPPSETLRLRRLAEESIKANARWKEAERVWKEAPTDENFKAVENLQADAIAADSLLREKLRRYEPRTLGGTLSTLLKGNLIAPISQARNLVGNAVNLPMLAITRPPAVLMDAIDAYMRNRPRTRASVGIRSTKEAVKAITRSLPDSLEVLRHGGAPGDLAKAEARVGLRPLVALRDAIMADVMGPKRNGKTPISQRLLMAMEASPFGMHAAAQLRLLGAVDKPFRAAAHARLVTEAMKIQDLNRKQIIARLRRDPSPEAQVERAALERMKTYTAANVAKAVKFPELFLDAPTVARIENEAATAVFQNRNVVASGLARMVSGWSPMARFAVDTIAPFTTTPANVIGLWLSYAPPVALFNLGRHAWRGEARAATQAASKFILGSMAFAAGQWLYQKGLVSPTLDQSDEQQKARILSGQSMPAGRLNLTGLQRAMDGEVGGWQPGDLTVDILSAGGVLGAALQTVADVNRRLERAPESPKTSDLALAFGANYVQLSAGYGVNQSFLKGTATLLEALMSPQKTESWTATYLDGLSSIALPNTMVALSRATRQNKPELRGDSLAERLDNQIKNRIGGTQRVFGKAGAEADLPLKRDLWGRPIRETPEGKNPYLNHFLEVTKAERIPTDSVALHLYSLWRQTGDLSAIPTPPDANFSLGPRRFDPLTRAQVDALQELVGRERYRIVSRVIDNPRFYLAPAAEQIAALKTIWSFGNQVGAIQFYKEHADELEQRREKAGFVPQ